MTNMESNEFSLSTGGPVYKQMHRIGLSKQGVRGIVTRVAITAMIVWLPLLIVSAAEGFAWGNAVKMPFLKDYAAYTRFLIAIPLLILAEIIIDYRLSLVVKNLASSGLVKYEDKTAFEATLRTLGRLRDSTIPEIVIIVIVYAMVLQGFVQELPDRVSTWRVVSANGGYHLSFAGYIYTFLSIPVFQFIMYRWVWRIIIWDWFLWRISRLKLKLNPTHPDLSGGLGILNIAQAAFFIIIFAVSAVFASVFAARIAYEGVPISQMEGPALVFVIVSVFVFQAPLLAFSPMLIIAKIQGQLEYGAFASEYTQSFDSKWLRSRRAEGESPLGSSDIQSLADLAHSFEIVQKMHVVPIDIPTAMLLAVSAIVPMLSLIFVAKSVTNTMAVFAKLVVKLLGF